jgi:hypothetical protein
MTVFYSGPVLLAFSILGFCLLLKRNKGAFKYLFLGMPVFYLGFILISTTVTYRYVTPVVPFIIVLTSYFIFLLYEHLFKKRSKILLIILIIIASSYSLTSSLLYSVKLLKPYTVRQGVEWIYQNVPQGSRVVSDIYLNSNKESIRFLEKHNMFGWMDTRKKYLLGLKEEKYPKPNYFLIDLNLTNVAALPAEEKKADYALVFFYNKGNESEKMAVLNELKGNRKLIAAFYPRGQKVFTKSLLNMEPHFFLKNIWETKFIGPNVEIYKFVE